MAFVKFIRSYIGIFHYLGLSPCHRERSNRLHTKIPIYANAAVSLTLCASILHILYTNENYSKFSKTTSVIMIKVFAGCEILRTVFGVIQCLYFKRHFYEIIHRFKHLHYVYEKGLRQRIKYEAFQKKYRTQMIVALSAYIQYVIVTIGSSVAANKLRPYNIQIALLQAMTLFSFLHITLYIEMLNFYLGQLVFAIRCARHDIYFSMNPSNTLQIRNKLKFLKTIHFQLWEVTQQINIFFGWTIVVLLLHAFVDVVYSVHKICENLQQTNFVFQKWTRR